MAINRKSSVLVTLNYVARQPIKIIVLDTESLHFYLLHTTNDVFNTQGGLHLFQRATFKLKQNLQLFLKS